MSDSQKVKMTERIKVMYPHAGTCKGCGASMIDINLNVKDGHNIQSDLDRRGIRVKYKGLEFGGVCIPCANEGKASFLCQLCGLQRPSNKYCTESPSNDAACTDCYETVSAKVWDKFCNDSYEANRY